MHITQARKPYCKFLDDALSKCRSHRPTVALTKDCLLRTQHHLERFQHDVDLTNDIVCSREYKQYMNTVHDILPVHVNTKTYQVPYTLSLWSSCRLCKHAAILSHGGGGPGNPGGDKDMSCLQQVAVAFAEAGVPCLRYTFKGEAKGVCGVVIGIDRDLRYKILIAIMTKAFNRIPELVNVRGWILGGLSVGGGNSVAASIQHPHLVLGLVCISYPDFRCDTLLRAVAIPVIFISGKQDPMIAGVDIASQVRQIKGPVMLSVIPRARHRLEVRHRTGKVDVKATRTATATVAQAVVCFLNAHKLYTKCT